MSALGASIKYTVVAVAVGIFFLQSLPSSEPQSIAPRDYSERQKVLDVMRKASGLDLPNTPSTSSKEK